MLMLSLALVMQAQAQATQTQAPSPEIVITGVRRQQELARCIERRCPPEEEVEAAMAAAVESFVAGNYPVAKRTLQTSVRRNNRHAARMPGKLSDLYATLSNVAEHDGDTELQRTAAIRSAGVLSDHVGRAHPATISAQANLANTLALLGLDSLADRKFGEVADLAQQAGNNRAAAFLNFRRAWLANQRKAWSDVSVYLARAEKLAPDEPRIRELTQILRIRQAFARKDQAEATKLIAGFQQSGQLPSLLHSPPYPTVAAERHKNRAATSDLPYVMNGRLNDFGDFSWVDIGFWIRPDGSIAEAEILRAARNGSAWAKPLLRQVEGRRYASSTDAEGTPGFYRIERFSLRPEYGSATGSRIARRAGDMSLRVVDLTHLGADALEEERRLPRGPDVSRR